MIDITTTFAENAWYFRNALVRANYTNLQKGIHETTEYLEAFLRNLLLDEKNELHISGLLNEEKVDIWVTKVDIENGKVDIQDKKVDIESVLSEKGSDFSVKTTIHIHRLFEKFGFDEVFGRSAVMELLPLGPVVMMDTPGIDDEGELGELRVKKSYQVLNKTDIAVVVIDGTCGVSEEDLKITERIQKKNIPYIIVLNKCERFTQEDERLRVQENTASYLKTEKEKILLVSAADKSGIYELKEELGALKGKEEEERKIVGDLLEPSDFVVLVVPIDSAAPKGRLILPQQQTIRDILDADASAIVVKETELAGTLASLGRKPKMVITDSQVFGRVSKDTPKDILLTSFSILFARYKGNLETMVHGVKALDILEDGDKVLISEGCTHHRQCDDIGTVKIPRWLKEYTGKELIIETSSGTEFPDELSSYKMIIHCGGCMLNEREMKYRISCAQDQGIPIANYGMVIAYIHGILKRSLSPFPEIEKLL